MVLKTTQLPHLNYEEILAALRNLGLTPGDNLLWHCSLSSIGYVDGGGEALIGAILAAIAPNGTALMPALPDIYQPFNVNTSPSTVGKVSELFRLRPDTVRSCHPSHSVVAIGPKAEELTVGHELTDPTGPDSPYDRLCKIGGYILLLGVDQDRNTILHLAEHLAGMVYLREATVQMVNENCGIRNITLRHMAYGHREFIGFDRLLRQAGLIRFGRIGNAIARLMKASDLVNFAVSTLKNDPTAFLCAKPSCIFCNWARTQIRVAATGAADDTNWLEANKNYSCGDAHCEVCVV